MDFLIANVTLLRHFFFYMLFLFLKQKLNISTGHFIYITIYNYKQATPGGRSVLAPVADGLASAQPGGRVGDSQIDGCADGGQSEARAKIG